MKISRNLTLTLSKNLVLGLQNFDLGQKNPIISRLFTFNCVTSTCTEQKRSLMICYSLIYPIVPARKKGIGASKCEYVFDVHTSKASKRLKVVRTTPSLAHYCKDDWRIY